MTGAATPKEFQMSASPQNQLDQDDAGLPSNIIQFVIADDQPFSRNLVIECLKRSGYSRFATAQDGLEALYHLKLRRTGLKSRSLAEMLDQRPDIAADLAPNGTHLSAKHPYCVVTDFNMPKLNGLHVLKAIRCGATRVPRDTPVLMLTGFTDDYVIGAALELDVNAFLVKPVSRKNINDKLARSLKVKLNIRPASFYEKVSIPDETGIGDFEEVGDPAPLTERFPEASPQSSTDAVDPQDDDICWKQLSLVKPGDILAQDLIGPSGSLMLGKGSVFTEGLLQKLKDVGSIKGLDGKLPIITVADEPN